MERADILSKLIASRTRTAPEVLSELAAEFGIPPADLLVIAGHPVSAELLPPERDAAVMKQFAYRASATATTRNWPRWRTSCARCRASTLDFRPVLLCRHVGRVFAAAVPLTGAQLIDCLQEAQRLSRHESRGAWQPVSEGFVGECPDFR
ncbi:hypothetical protein [Streptomyces sp. NPDC051364]|uniref:hypothetical protein n=1 Tax=Streptomyces sp. NPDC051364 TaxID=3155799 RepID=UPI003412634F